ncbi:MAG: plastocyanin [SAR202 cluster bacterium]|nr:plastocyanin [SAR202 cluster bacterium]
MHANLTVSANAPLAAAQPTPLPTPKPTLPQPTPVQPTAPQPTAVPPTPTAPAPAAVVAVAIQTFAFGPASTEVKAGGKVVWTNQDPVPHTVTAADGTFDSFLTTNQSFERVFSVAGTFQYRCTLHPSMQGQVVVVP